MYWLALFWFFNYLLGVKQTSNFSLMEVFLVVTKSHNLTPNKKGSFSSKKNPFQVWGTPNPPAIIGWPGLKWHPLFWSKISWEFSQPSCFNVIPTSPFRIWLPWHDHKWPARNLFAGKRSWNYCRAILWKALWTQRLACSKPPEFFWFFQLQVQVFPPCSQKKKTAMDANRQRPWRLRCAALASLVSAFVLPAFVLPSQCAPHTTKSPRQDARVTMYIVTPGPDSHCLPRCFKYTSF